MRKASAPKTGGHGADTPLVDGADAPPDGERLSADLMQFCAESARVAPWTLDPVTRAAWRTDLFFELLGYAPGGFAANSQAFRDLMHPEDRDEAIRSMEDLIAGKTSEYHAIFRLQRRDGTWRWYESTARMAETPDGKPIVCGGLKDIHTAQEYKLESERLLKRATTAQVEAQNALAEAEEARSAAKASDDMLRLAVVFGNQAAWSNCRDTGEAWLMDAGYEMLGYSPEEFVPNAEGWRGIIHPDDLHHTMERIGALFEGRTETFESIQRLRHGDGSYHWYRVMSRLQNRSEKGLPPLLAGMIVNIDELKAGEERLSEAVELAEQLRFEAKSSEEMLRISLAAGDQLAWSICPDTGEGWLAVEGYAILGYTPEEFTPDDAGWRSLIHPDDLDRAIRAMDRFANGETDTYRCEQRLRYKDGSYHWYRAVARMIDRSGLGLPMLIAGTTVCIDEEKDRENRLSEAVAEAVAARAEAQQSAEILRVSSENSGVVPWYRIQETDEFWFNSNITDFLGLPAGTEVNLENWIESIHPEDLPVIAAAIDAIKDGKTDRFDVEIRALHGDGHYFWCRSVGRRIRRKEQGLPDMICGAQFSIDELKQNEIRQAEAAEQLQQANMRLTTIADNAPAGIYEFRRFPDGRIEFPYASARFCDLFGVTQDELATSPERPFERIHEDDLPRLMSSIEVSQKSLEVWTMRARALHPERGMRWFSGSSSPKRLDDGSVSWIGVLTDVTDDVTRELALKEAHQLAEQMRVENERLALHDPLTGLPNRRYFDQLFQSRLDMAEREGPRDVCLIRVDLDKFKYINDTFGHEAGDAALKHVGRTMQDCAREQDFVGRIGGDEFSILMSPGSNERAAASLVNRMRSRLEEPMAFVSRNLHVRASFGVAYAKNILDYGRDLQFFADKALYTAKDSGRNQVQFFTSDLHKDILDDRGFAADLQEALHTDQFVPHFQPQISAQSGELVGIETLLRWQHPTRGLLTPDKFMPLAEQMRIMPEIDRLTYRTALELVRDWELEGLVIPKISFNISSGRMRDTSILHDTEHWHRSLNARITFELLESILVENESAEFNENLAEVRTRGIDIEIDDFGSGHASIIAIMAIEPSALKIDRRLVQPVGQDPKYLDVIRGIVGIANTLGVTTIAEGVETAEQARELAEIGCGSLQGYHFSRPLSPSAFRDYLKAASVGPGAEMGDRLAQ